MYRFMAAEEREPGVQAAGNAVHLYPEFPGDISSNHQTPGARCCITRGIRHLPKKGDSETPTPPFDGSNSVYVFETREAHVTWPA